MSITLAAADTITGVAGSATSITYTITGDELAAGADTFKVLAQGQLPSSIGTLYTVPGSTATIVKTIHLVNGTGGSVTAKLALKGTAAANVILPAITILAGGFATYGDDGWNVYNDQGQKLGLGATGATGATGAGVAVGGTIHQVLTKLSSTNYDTDWETPSAGFTNPMTTAGDLIVGDTGGAAIRLGKGADNQVLTIDPTTHLIVWANNASGFSNPMTTAGDIIIGGSSGTPTRLASPSDSTKYLNGAGAYTVPAGGGGGGGTPAENAAALVYAYSTFR